MSTILDNCIFYERTNAHLDNGALVEKNPNLFTNTRYYSKSLHATQNPPSQPAIYILFDYSRPLLIAKSLDVLTFLIKTGRSTCFAFFDFLNFFRQTQCILYNRDFVNRLQNSNVHHVIRSSPPVTNPNS